MNIINTSSRGKKYMILGVLLFLAPPLILLIIYGNLNITGFGYTLSFFSIPVTLIGIVIFVKGLLMAKPKSPDVIIDKLHLDNPVINTINKSTSSQNNWIWALVLAIISIIDASQSWQNNNDPGLAKIMFITFITATVIIYAIYKYKRKIPWSVLLIGNMDLAGRDERETSILHKAAQYSLAVSIGLIMELFALLIFLPRPSLMAISDLSFAFIFFVAGIYGFFAWKLGLK